MANRLLGGRRGPGRAAELVLTAAASLWQTQRTLQEQPLTPSRMRADGWRVACAFLVWLVAGAGAAWLGAPPAPLPASAPAEVASGGRALALLERIAREDGGGAPQPRPPGSAANARCRERILTEWRRMGFDPEVSERVTVAADRRVAGLTRNIVVRLRGDGRGRGPGSAILCMAHYDSVPAGPGISDDLAGVAGLLEVARALEAGGGTSRDVIFLFEDAEEGGLLGAEAFAQHHPWAADVGAVINLEARGTGGLSRMFETGAGNAEFVGAWARAASRPSAHSVSVEVYRRMPNDTDFSVWRERGVPGLNFAYIGGVARYHTPVDDLAHLDPRSLQHHVTNAFEAVLALDGLPFSEAAAEGAGAAGDVAFFDVGSRRLVTVPLTLLRGLAALSFLLTLVGVGRALGRGALGFRGLALALLGIPVAVGLAALASQADLNVLRSLGAPDATFSAATHVIAISVVALGLGLLLALVVFLSRFMSAAETCGAVALSFSLAGMLLSWSAPGAAPLLVLPALVLAAAWFLFPRKGDLGARACNAGVVAVGVAAIQWTPFHLSLLDAFGASSGVSLLGPLLPCAALCLPGICRAAAGASPWFSAALVACGIAAGAAATQSRPFTEDEPGRLNLVHLQSSSGSASWHVLSGGAAVDAEERSMFASALGGATLGEDREWIPWSGQAAFAVSTGPSEELPPELEVVEVREAEGTRTIRLRMRSARGGDELMLRAWGLDHLRVDGVTLPSPRILWLGPGTEWREFEIDVVNDPLREVAFAVFDKRFSLGRDLARRAELFMEERAPLRVPSGDGDGSVVRADLTLRPDPEGEGVVLGPKGEGRGTEAGPGGDR